MSKKEVQLEILNRQEISKGGQEELEFDCKGLMYVKRGSIYLLYSETGEGLSGARTTLKFNPQEERVLIQRKGSGGLKQKFIEGQTHCSFYKTGQGKLEMKTETDSLNILTRERADEIIGGELQICYRLYLGSSYLSSNDLKIKFELLDEEISHEN